MNRYLTTAQARTVYPDPGTVARMLHTHGHDPWLNLHTTSYRRPWQLGDDALCAQTDPEVFFPEKGDTTEPAKYVCGRCDARQDCLLWALQAHERFGIWGGVSERDRRPLIRAAGRLTIPTHHAPNDTDHNDIDDHDSRDDIDDHDSRDETTEVAA